MTIEFSPLPYERDALEPHMSRETLDYHYGKHHKSYVEKTKKAIKGTAFEDRSLEDIIRATRDDEDNRSLFNNSAQAWNHNFFWKSMTGEGSEKPENTLMDRIEKDFGSFEKFKEQFKDEATGHFASGWCWLVWKDDELKVVSTHDADTPVAHDDMEPLLGCDLWEHAYYIDYRNERGDFVETFLGKLANWAFAARNWEAARDGESMKEAA